MRSLTPPLVVPIKAEKNSRIIYIYKSIVCVLSSVLEGNKVIYKLFFYDVDHKSEVDLFGWGKK